MSTTPAPDDVRPNWFHRCGPKMAIESFDAETLSLTLQASSAKLEITPHEKGTFLVRWTLFNTKHEKTEGVMVFSQDRLKAAFMVPVTLPSDFSSFLANYDATDGVPGYFIRRGRFLNIPCPGTAYDGDPNLSVFVTDEIKKAVKAITRLQAH